MVDGQSDPVPALLLASFTGYKADIDLIRIEGFRRQGSGVWSVTSQEEGGADQLTLMTSIWLAISAISLIEANWSWEKSR